MHFLLGLAWSVKQGIRVLSHLIHPKNWFMSVDLKDSYFHISIYKHHTKQFLRFARQVTAYKFLTVLFICLESVASKRVEAYLTLLRTVGLRVSADLDDLLLCVLSQKFAEIDKKMLMSHLENPGFNISETKGCLVPTQEII